mmetsp:Transcript_21048/g.59782  ORF Transcript_21048/g.59782 Transcript_21048/m.59782 type:complete len:410 (+) Transcript_21048:73-1302(+)
MAAKGGCGRPLLSEGLVSLIDFLEASSIAKLRRACHFEGLSEHARNAELATAVLEHLEKTAFPFTHAAYVLGLNGPYYSCDTLAKNHYGIPAALPGLLCRYFRQAAPEKQFTTIRLQKLAAAGNFGGKHRTLAFCLAGQDDGDGEVDSDQSMGTDSDDAATPCAAEEDTGYAIFLSSGCSGGRGEVCEDLSSNSWHVLGRPERVPRWVKFPRGAWLQWHWPSAGSYYVITVTCEPPANRCRLTPRERLRMREMGFCLPRQDGENEDAMAVDDSAPTPERPARRPQGRRNAAAIHAARRLLGLDAETPLVVAEVEEAFRRRILVAHPDHETMGATGPQPAPQQAVEDPTASALTNRMRGWAVSQIMWARRVLREEAEWRGHGAEEAEGAAQAAEAPVQPEFLMLGAPPPQ